MSIRVILCFLFVVYFSWYAYRNWFRSLCATVVLMAFLENPDLPKKLLGIPGMNLWNLLLINVILAWRIQRQRKGLVGDMPQSLKIAFILYVGVVITAFLRLWMDPTDYIRASIWDIAIDLIVNPMKFLIPCFLLYDGCRTNARASLALGAIVLLYFCIAVQVIRYMGLHPDFSGAELSGRAAKILQHSVGYNRVDLSMMLAGASWATLAFSRLVEKRWHRWGLWIAAGLILFAQSLTGGRTGYVSWGAIGLILCSVKWRRLLPVIPAAVIVVVLFVPGVAERMLSGFGGKSGAIRVEEDTSEITSGRSLVWPEVIKKIQQSPVIGYGRLGMLRTGLTSWAAEELGDEFGHPHNAYLEMLLDNGVVGLLCIMPLFAVILWRSLQIFLHRTDRLFEAGGGMALALVLALLFGSFGAQTLYPREGVVGMWAAIGVALRLSVERARESSAQEAEDPEPSDWQASEAPAA